MPALARTVAKCVRLPVEKYCLKAYGMVDARYPACQIRLGTLQGTNLYLHQARVEVVLVLFRSPKSVPPAQRKLSEIPAKVGGGPIRVLVALGSPMDCELLSTAVKRSRQPLDVVASAVSRKDVVHSFSRGNVDVALINVDLEDGRMTGLEVLPELHATHERTPVVMLFDTWQDELIVNAFRAGARGVYCRLEKKLEMLWRCISAVHRGQVWANSAQLQLLLNTVRSAAPIRTASPSGMNLLGVRETQVANLVAEGLPNKGIAQRLGISEHTVGNYLFRIYNKLGISSRVELVLYVLKQREQSPMQRA
jgi:two-component system nitrate/nitrite response regulator NarL